LSGELFEYHAALPNRLPPAGRPLADAVRRLEEFANAMDLNDPKRPSGLLRRLLEDTAEVA
jgi:hypothetical protein